MTHPNPESPGWMNETISPRTAKTLIIGALVAAVIIFLSVSGILGGDDPQEERAESATEAPQETPQPSAPAPPSRERPTLSAAKPSTSLASADGCADPDDDLVDELVDTLGQSGVTVELSATWADNGDVDAAALMVRSSEGTIDQPHLVWVNADGEWQSASRDTMEASDAPEADVEDVTGRAANAVVQCRTAGSR